MANSLKAKLKKLRYQRRITEEEYKELIKKLDGHDKRLIMRVMTEDFKCFTDDEKGEER